MLNLFQHPWPDLSSSAALIFEVRPWTLKQVQGDERRAECKAVCNRQSPLKRKGAGSIPSSGHYVGRMTKYLHTMIRVTDPDATTRFFQLIGLEEVRRFDNEAGRFTLIFLAPPGQEGVAEVELTYNWPPERSDNGGVGKEW